MGVQVVDKIFDLMAVVQTSKQATYDSMLDSVETISKNKNVALHPNNRKEGTSGHLFSSAANNGANNSHTAPGQDA